MRYAIQNNGGEWWTGHCFGVAQAREEYNSLDDLPSDIETNGGTALEKEEFSLPRNGFLDIRYYADEAGSAEASVVEIG